MVLMELRISKIKGKALTLIGPRRAGKTYYFFNLMNNLKRKNTLYMDFEEIFLRNLTGIEVLKIIVEIFPEVIGNDPKYVFLDEIQNVKNWESLVRTLLRKDYDVFLTGSSSKFLSKEIATQLRGRTLSYTLLPFSFREFLQAKNRKYNLNILSHVGKLKRDLREYMELGGFPEVILNKEKDKILREYLDLAFFKDFVERHDVKSLSLARSMFTYVLQNFSKEMSIRSMEKKLRGQGVRFDVMTAYKYMKNMEDTMLFFYLKKYSGKAHLRETWPKKVYLCDTGLTRTIRLSEDQGKLMENTVFLDLLRKTNENALLKIFYLKLTNGEVDFVVKDGVRIKELIQVTRASGKDEIEEREIKSLIKASELVKCNNLRVLTWGYEGEETIKRKKIRFTPLWRWLLK